MGLRALVQFTGSRALPIEQGNFVRPSLPRHPSRCNFCSKRAVGNELIALLTALTSMPSEFGIPAHFRMLRYRYRYAFVYVAQTPKGCQPLPHSHSANGPDMDIDRPHKPGWLNGLSESLSHRIGA